MLAVPGDLGLSTLRLRFPLAEDAFAKLRQPAVLLSPPARHLLAIGGAKDVECGASAPGLRVFGRMIRIVHSSFLLAAADPPEPSLTRPSRPGPAPRGISNLLQQFQGQRFRDS